MALGGPTGSGAMAAGLIAVAASAGEASLRTPGAGCEGLVVAVTGPLSGFSSLYKCATPKISTAPHAAMSTDANATNFAIEADVITTIRRPTDRYRHYELTLRRFYPLIKSCCAEICRSIGLTNAVRRQAEGEPQDRRRIELC
jgi:hypothetical protein